MYWLMKAITLSPILPINTSNPFITTTEFRVSRDVPEANKDISGDATKAVDSRYIGTLPYDSFDSYVR